jgi:dihydroorotate dehydrogenase electron transfer subunit
MTATTRGQFVSRVHSNVRLCRDHYRLVLSLPQFPPTEPGQFVQLQCQDSHEAERVERELDWQPGQPPELGADTLLTPGAMLRRPFSLAGRRDVGGRVEIDIIHRIVGIGTEWLSRLGVGDEVGVLGPLGNKFDLPRVDATAVLVGGGVGIPPMLYLAEKLAGRSAVAFCGALTRDLLPLMIVQDVPPNGATPTRSIADFARHGIPSVITTDDGSYGLRGFVTQALEQYLDALSTQNSALSTVLYTCGPEPMMKRVADIAAARGIECQIAVERAMACGMGTCQSCCIRVKKTDPSRPPLAGRDWCYRLACTDGPVFRGRDLLW